MGKKTMGKNQHKTTLLPKRIGKYDTMITEYSNPRSLMYKKLRIIHNYINKGDSLLDLGLGTGDLIDLEKQKFNSIYGVDISIESIDICKKRFKNQSNVTLIQSSIEYIETIFEKEQFDCITSCDVLEHVSLEKSKNVLKMIYRLLKKNDGMYIFTGPGFFEKFRIALNRVPEHSHSHSSYGWKNLIEEAGFKIVSIETVEFPLIDNEFLRKQFHLFGKCCLIVALK